MRPEARPAEILHRLLDAIPPASGAVVMGTGIVSVALLLDHRHTLSVILLVLDGGFWLALAVLLPARALADRPRFQADSRQPAALTSIAGTEVLGTRLTLAGWDWAGAILLVVVLWWLTIAWLPALVAAEAVRPRLRYNVRRWSTVFPVGMYAACSFVVGPLSGAPGITDFARVWVWIAVAVWLLVFVAMAGRSRELIGPRGVR